MAYSFYGGRKGNGLDIVAAYQTKETNGIRQWPDRASQEVQYGEYCIVDEVLYRRKLADAGENEWLPLGHIAYAANGDVTVQASTYNYYNLSWNTTPMNEIHDISENQGDNN